MNLFTDRNRITDIKNNLWFPGDWERRDKLGDWG